MTTTGGAQIKKGQLGDEVSVNVDADDSGKLHIALNFRGVDLPKSWLKSIEAERQVIISFSLENEQIDNFVKAVNRAKEHVDGGGRK